MARDGGHARKCRAHEPFAEPGVNRGDRAIKPRCGHHLAEYLLLDQRINEHAVNDKEPGLATVGLQQERQPVLVHLLQGSWRARGAAFQRGQLHIKAQG